MSNHQLAPEALTFGDLRTGNLARQAHWGGAENWTLADWSNAMAGEAGEACNVVKKIRRVELGTTGNKDTTDAYRKQLESEIGDVLIYLDLLANAAGVTLDHCVTRAFNEKSAELGMPIFLPAPADTGQGGRVEELEAALAELVDTLEPVEGVPLKDPAYGDEVRALGARIGFGALMATASYEWRAWLAENGYPLGGEFVSGPCRSVLESDLRAARAALDAGART
jgi:NTP pyrophosphatase (non-canonical NTP hydrolase)